MDDLQVAKRKYPAGIEYFSEKRIEFNFICYGGGRTVTGQEAVSRGKGENLGLNALNEGMRVSAG